MRLVNIKPSKVRINKEQNEQNTKEKINDEDVKLKKNEYDRQYRLRNKKVLREKRLEYLRRTNRTKGGIKVMTDNIG